MDLGERASDRGTMRIGERHMLDVLAQEKVRAPCEYLRRSKRSPTARRECRFLADHGSVAKQRAGIETAIDTQHAIAPDANVHIRESSTEDFDRLASWTDSQFDFVALDRSRRGAHPVALRVRQDHARRLARSVTQ